MKRYYVATLMFVMFCTFLSQGKAKDDVGYWRLKGADLACVIENIDRYVKHHSAKAKIFIVSVSSCPDFGVESDVALQNADPGFKIGGPDVDNFIALGTADVVCLKSLIIPDASILFRFYPATCRLEADE